LSYTENGIMINTCYSGNNHVVTFFQSNETHGAQFITELTFTVT